MLLLAARFLFKLCRNQRSGIGKGAKRRKQGIGPARGHTRNMDTLLGAGVFTRGSRYFLLTR